MTESCGFDSCLGQHILKNEASKSHSGKSNHAYKAGKLENIGLVQHMPILSRLLNRAKAIGLISQAQSRTIHPVVGKNPTWQLR